MMKKQKHPQKKLSICIVVGPMPFSWSVLRPYLKSPETQVFFVDGGLIHREKFQKHAPHLLKNALSIGDGDSSKELMKIKKTDQNISDLAFFLQTIKGKKEIETYQFVGFLGGRLDHQLFNLGELSLFSKKLIGKIIPKILMENKVEFLVAGTHQVNIDGNFSLGSFEVNRIKLSGHCLYQSKKWLTLSPLSSRGLSNQGQGLIKIETLAPLAIFYS